MLKKGRHNCSLKLQKLTEYTKTRKKDKLSLFLFLGFQVFERTNRIFINF